MDRSHTPDEPIRQRRALEILTKAAQELTPTRDFDYILKRTVELATGLMETANSSSRYFSHVAVKEGDLMVFVPEHNFPEIQGYLESALGKPAQISLMGARVGITGDTALRKRHQNVANVRDHTHYVDLQSAGGSQLSVPIMIDDDVFAVLNIEHERVNAFDEQDVQTMLALASIVSSAIKQRDSNLTQNALFSAVRALTQSHEQDGRLRSVLDQVAEQAYKLLALRARKPGGFAHVGLVQGPYLVYLASYPNRIIDRFAEERYARIDLRDYNTYDETGKRRRMGISGYAVIARETQNVPDVGKHPEYLQVNLDPSEGGRTINSQLAVPIRLLNGDVVGVISIDHPAFGAFSVRDVDNVRLLADVASEAYRINRQNERQTRALEVLQEAAMHIREDLGLDSILRELTVQAKRMVEREFTLEEEYTSHIALRQGNELVFAPEHNDERVYSAFHIAGHERVRFRGTNDRIGIVGRAALSGQTQLVENVQVDPDYFAIRQSGTQLSVPIKVDGQVYAVLSVEHRKPNFFDQDDRLTLEALAAQAGAIITILNSQLEQLRLEEGLKQREEFVAHVSHEMRKPITKTAAFIQNLAEGNFESFDDPEFKLALSAAQRSARDQHQVVERLLHVARTGTEKLEFAHHNLIELIDDMIADSLDAAQAKGVALYRDPPPHTPLILEFDHFCLRHVVSNLLQNAVKYTDNGQVVVRCRQTNDRVYVRVEDSGSGIPAEHHKAVFERLMRAKTTGSQRDGLGVGLYLAKHYVTLHNGDIYIAWSEEGKGTHIEFWLPLKR